MSAAELEVAVIGGGVVGCAVAHALARRGVSSLVIEAEAGLAFGASGANSGILHTGFDSTPGELETRLILRAAALREQLVQELGVPVWRCGALLRPSDEEQRATIAGLAENAHANGVEATLTADGALRVPGESITDPVAFTEALARCAQVGGAQVRLGARVVGLTRGRVESGAGGVAVQLEDGDQLRARAVVNCAGLRADELAELAGERRFEIYPRKGEFLVYRAPAELDRILLPVPSRMGKGVLVFPTLDGSIVAGPTAREREDKDDWSVERDAVELIRARALRMYPPLERAELLGAYAGLRPAGRNANYVIDRSRELPGLVHVAAIRSTGLSASLGIGEYVTSLLAEQLGVRLGPERPLPAPAPAPAQPEPWWQRAARRHASTP